MRVKHIVEETSSGMVDTMEKQRSASQASPSTDRIVRRAADFVGGEKDMLETERGMRDIRTTVNDVLPFP
jgi:hypothetical protein